MKSLLVLLISFTIFSCNGKNQTHINDQNKSEIEMEESHMKMHKEMDKVGFEIHKFESELITLYSESEKKPEKIIIKADSLLNVNKNEKDKYKSQIKDNIKNDLHYLKAELFYKLGNYHNSLLELEAYDYKSGDAAAAYAANYVKLKDFKKAKSFIDNIGNYIYDYALGNYYESVGNKATALKVYYEIKKDKSIKHYAYYKLAVNRYEELKKSNSKLLNEIYFPTGNPSFEICDSDNENRSKIFKLMQELPENQDWAGTHIVESPQENDKNYYWVRVTTKQDKELNYYIYQETFEVKFFDAKNNKLITLDEWRK